MVTFEESMSGFMKTEQTLGQLLQEAFLVSETQVNEALKQQSSTPNSRLGEILAEKGWLKQSTADFFAEQWSNLMREKGELPDQPLGYYLKKAGLLDDAQIESLLAEQEEGRLWVRLGAYAVLKGWINQGTVDFFVENLYPERATESPFIKPQKS